MSQIQEKLVLLSNKAKNAFLKKKFDEIIFLDRDFSKSIKPQNSSKFSPFDSKLCIILSPSLYWIRKRELQSVHSIYSARKISKAVFDDLDDANLVIRILKGEGSSYYFIAIDKANILSQIQKYMKIDSPKCHFCLSQDFFSNITKPIEISETQSLADIDGVIERVPSVYLAEKSKKTLSEHIKTASGAFFETFTLPTGETKSISGSMDTSSIAIKLLAASLLILTLSWTVESIIHVKNGSKIAEKIEQLKESYKLPSTSMETDNIISKAKSIESTQNSIREITKAVNSLSLPKEETLESIKISPNSVVFTIKTNRGEAIKSDLSKSIKISSAEKSGELTLFKVAIK